MYEYQSPSFLKNIIELSLVIVFLIGCVAYGAAKTRYLFLGPSIEIISPFNGESVEEDMFEVTGRLTRAVSMHINGKLVPLDSNGYFSKQIVALSPYSIVLIEAKDKHGTQSAERLIVGKVTKSKPTVDAATPDAIDTP